MAFDDKDVQQVNQKLDTIDKKVTDQEPSFISKWLGRLKYPLIGLTWVIGALTHKWGLFHFIGKLMGMVD
jgi:hypothetical protein